MGSKLKKTVMTGVVCPNAFSPGNSFTNYSLDEKYSEAFGFSRKEIEEHEQITALIDHLLEKHRSQLPKDYVRNSKENQRHHFIAQKCCFLTQAF